MYSSGVRNWKALPGHLMPFPSPHKRTERGINMPSTNPIIFHFLKIKITWCAYERGRQSGVSSLFPPHGPGLQTQLIGLSESKKNISRL